MTKNAYIASYFDDFLEDGMLDEINLIAIKRVIAWQIKEAMAEKILLKQQWLRK